MTLKINTTNEVILDDKLTGLCVTQTRSGTVVYRPERPGLKYKAIPMPHNRYQLGSDSPITKPGVASRDTFEDDIRAVTGH